MTLIVMPPRIGVNAEFVCGSNVVELASHQATGRIKERHGGYREEAEGRNMGGERQRRGASSDKEGASGNGTRERREERGVRSWLGWGAVTGTTDSQCYNKRGAATVIAVSTLVRDALALMVQAPGCEAA